MKTKLTTQKVVLAAVIVKKNAAIILQRSQKEKFYPGMWELPGGKKELFEDIDRALIREVKEETSVKIQSPQVFSVFDYVLDNDTEIRDTTQINFVAEVSNNADVKISKEHQNYAWVTKKELSRYRISKETKAVILKAFEYLRKHKI